MLGTGEQIPAFTLEADNGASVNTHALGNERTVLYLYPADDTPGCTAEACNFRDNLPNFQSLGVPIYGISPDDVEKHTQFRDKYSLNFPLLADPGHHFIDALGAWVEKEYGGKKYMGVQRSTFILDSAGHIEHVWPQVKPAEHGAEVLDWLKAHPANGS